MGPVHQQINMSTMPRRKYYRTNSYAPVRSHDATVKQKHPEKCSG